MLNGHEDVYQDYRKARQMIIDGVEQDPNVAVASASYFVIIRLLERISDHIVNLASWVIYKSSGELFELISADKKKTQVKKKTKTAKAKETTKENSKTKNK